MEHPIELLRRTVQGTSKTPSPASKLMSSARYESQKSNRVQVKSRTLQKSKVAGYTSQLHVLASSRHGLRRLRSHNLFPNVAANDLLLRFVTSLLRFICFSVFHKSEKQPELIVSNNLNPLLSSAVAFE